MPKGYRKDGTLVCVRGIRRDQAPLHVRFWEKVDKRGPDECWPWLGAKKSDGYGMLYTNPNMTQAHIISLWLHGVHVPSRQETGMTVDHICNRRDCVNPAHLRIISHAANTLRGTSPHALNRKKTHCVKGHPLSGDNIVWIKVPQQKNKERFSISRTCLTCYPHYINSCYRVDPPADRVAELEAA